MNSLFYNATYGDVFFINKLSGNFNILIPSFVDISFLPAQKHFWSFWSHILKDMLGTLPPEVLSTLICSDYIKANV